MGVTRRPVVVSPADLRAYREAHGLTRRECAAMVYVTEGAWCLWERGRSPIPQGTWEYFCLLLRIRSLREDLREELNDAQDGIKFVIEAKE